MRNLAAVTPLLFSLACVHEMPTAHEPGGDEDGAVVVFDAATELDEFGEAPPQVSPFPFVRLGVRSTSFDAASVEVRTSVDGATWSPWTAPTIVFTEEDTHAGHVDVTTEAPALHFQHRVTRGHAPPTWVALEPISEVGVIPSEAETAASGAIDASSPTDEQGLNINLVSRSAWGARPARCREATSVRHATVHHTAGANDDATPAARQMRQIQAFHMFTRGWCDVGYNFLVSRDGKIFEGRGYGILGAHTENANSGNMGISFIGTYTSVNPPLAQQIAGAKVLRYLKDRAGIPLTRDGVNGVKGHRQRGTTSTTCPGDKLYAKLGSLIERARTNDFDMGPCATGNFDGAFCDDDNHGSEAEHNKLVRQLDVDFHCADKDGSPAFCPSTEATRKDAIFVFGKAAGMPTAGHPDAFPDDDGKREGWFNAAKAFGIIGGINGKAMPDRKLTRSSAAVILSRMYALPPASQDFFDDDQGDTNEDAHNRVAQAGLFTGYSDANGGRRDFKPSVIATRSSLAVLAVRADAANLVPRWDIPDACLGGGFTGTFCDDDGTNAEASHEALVDAGVSIAWGRLADRPVFQATKKANRGTVVYMLTQAAGIPVNGHPDAFNDDDDHARERWFDAAKAFGIIGGTEARASSPANRDMLAIVLARIYGLPATNVDYFSDDDGTSMEPWHNKVAEAGLFTGSSDGRGGRAFRGTDDATRGQIATVHARAQAAALVPIWAP